VPRYPDTPRGEAGFTLLELVLVLLVLSIMAGLVFPKFRNLGAGDVKVEARTLIGRIQGLYNEATFTRRTHRLVFDLDAERYWGEVQNADDSYAPVSRTLMGPVDLPPGIDLKDVITERAGKRADGHAYCYFHPLGRADVTTIHLESKGGDELTLQVNPLTGKVDVKTGYVETFEG
jgi:prepilin-type N-terminal cleavage/methylation domain-containing protein